MDLGAATVGLKAFNFGVVRYNPDPALILDVVIAAPTLTTARMRLTQAGFARPRRHLPAVPREAAEIALLNPEVPVWKDLEDASAITTWSVGPPRRGGPS